MTRMLPLQVCKCSVYFILVFSSLTILGCSIENSRKTYGSADLKIRVIQDETAQKTLVVFSTLMETQFYSPGARVATSGKDVTLEFVRAGIQDKDFQIDRKAPYLVKWIEGRNVSPALRDRLMENSTSADQLLDLQADVSAIYVKDGDDKELVWKESRTR